MTLKPPTKEQRGLRVFYFVSILLLAAMGIMANAKQRTIEQAKQDKLQQNETDARNQFSSDLKDVKTYSYAILNLVTNPPKGFTRDQVDSIARLFLNQQKENSKVALDNLLRTMAPGIVADMRNWLEKWDSDAIAIQIEDRILSRLLPRPSDQDFAPMSDEINQKSFAMNKIYTNKISPTLTNADNLRRSLLEGSVPTQEDQRNGAIFAKVLAGEPINVNDMRGVTDYMGNLVKRFLPNSATAKSG
jgi:hypothetical protein